MSACDDKAELQALALIATKHSSDSSDVSTWQMTGNQRLLTATNTRFRAVKHYARGPDEAASPLRKRQIPIGAPAERGIRVGTKMLSKSTGGSLSLCLPKNLEASYLRASVNQTWSTLLFVFKQSSMVLRKINGSFTHGSKTPSLTPDSLNSKTGILSMIAMPASTWFQAVASLTS